LGTKAFFDFNPDEDHLKKEIGKILWKRAKKVTKQEYEQYKNEAKQKLIETETKKPL